MGADNGNEDHAWLAWEIEKQLRSGPVTPWGTRCDWGSARAQYYNPYHVVVGDCSGPSVLFAAKAFKRRAAEVVQDRLRWCAREISADPVPLSRVEPLLRDEVAGVGQPAAELVVLAGHGFAYARFQRQHSGGMRRLPGFRWHGRASLSNEIIAFAVGATALDLGCVSVSQGTFGLVASLQMQVLVDDRGPALRLVAEDG